MKEQQIRERKESESGEAKTYLFLQIALAAVSLITIMAGSFYFEKYQEEWVTSLNVTLL